MCTITDKINAEISEAKRRLDDATLALNHIDVARRSARNMLDTIGSALDAVTRASAQMPGRVDAAVAVRQAPVAEQVVVMLNGCDKLRSFQAVSDATGLSFEDIECVLDNAGIEYVTKRRVRDGAELLGLAARN